MDVDWLRVAVIGLGVSFFVIVLITSLLHVLRLIGVV
jgi:hypothetical protein